MKSVRISAKAARALLSMNSPDNLTDPLERRALEEVKAALRPRYKPKSGAQRKREKKALLRAESEAMRAAVLKRSGGMCEVCRAVDGYECAASEIHHVLGRARAVETEATCLSVCRACHRDITENKPSAAHWLAIQGFIFEGWGHTETSKALRRSLARAEAKQIFRERENA